MATTPKTRQSMPDSEALNPDSRKSHSKETIRAHLVWTAYSITHVKFTAPPINQPCWVFKQAGKLNAENKEKGLHSDGDEEPQPPNTGGQKKFPPQVKTVNMIYATHIPKRERKRALRDVYAMEPVAPKFNP